MYFDVRNLIKPILKLIVLIGKSYDQKTIWAPLFAAIRLCETCCLAHCSFGIRSHTTLLSCLMVFELDVCRGKVLFISSITIKFFKFKVQKIFSATNRKFFFQSFIVVKRKHNIRTNT